MGHSTLAPKLQLKPTPIRFEEYISWCPGAKFEFFDGKPQISYKRGTKQVLGLLLMTFGLTSVVKVLPPQAWIRFRPPMRLLLRLISIMFNAAKLLTSLIKQLSHILMEIALVAFERQHIVSLLFDNLLDNGDLASHIINADHSPARFNTLNTKLDYVTTRKLLFLGFYNRFLVSLSSGFTDQTSSRSGTGD